MNIAHKNILPTDFDRWNKVNNNFQRLSSSVGLGPGATPPFAGVKLTGLTASTLIGVNASKVTESVTIGTGLDYTRPTLSLSHLGIEALTDPGADRVLFWDNSETACKWLGVGNSIAITNTTLDTIQDIRTSASPTFVGLTLSGITAEATDVDKFLVDSSGVIKYRTGAQILSDIGAQTQGDVLDDLNTLGAPASDGQFIVATGAGVFAYESTTTARTSLGVGTGDSPAFAAVSLGTGELTCGSINRAADTLTLEIGGTAEVSITSTTVTLGGNLIIPNSGTIGSVGDTDVMTIDASGNCTFSVFPITPSAAPDANYEVANKKYVDDNAGGAFSSRCSVYRSGTQSIASGDWYKVLLNAEDYDIDGEFDSTANYRFQPDTTGYYHVSVAGQIYNLEPEDQMYAGIRKNGNVWKSQSVSVGASFSPIAAISCDMYLLDTDYIELWVYHDYGANRDVGHATLKHTFMDVYRFA